jgi:methionyl-tRNA synthetase
MLFARKDLKDVLERAAEITKKQKAEFEKSQKMAAINLAKAGLAPAPKESDAEGDSEQKEIDIPAKEEITFDDFGRMQFQIGEILECKAVENSKKLLCSRVKIGSSVKQIVSGIRKYYSPEEMVGKKVLVLVNLKPAKLAGVLSEGMLLCAEDADGNLSLMTPEKDMPSGAEVC